MIVNHLFTHEGILFDSGYLQNALGLDQRQAGEIFGGGVNAFSRYETGKVRTPVSVMQLFTLLNRHPELIEEIKERRYRIGGVHEFREESSAQTGQLANVD
jgi:HTH-type transcriptional regulator/antitoxin MqsA